MELQKVLNIRKSIRSYTGEGITDAQLERIALRTGVEPRVIYAMEEEK